jgi:hypothetical protein
MADDSRHDGGERKHICRWRFILPIVVAVLVIRQLSTQMPSVLDSTIDYSTFAAAATIRNSSAEERPTSNTNVTTTTTTSTTRSTVTEDDDSSIAGSVTDPPEKVTIESISENNTVIVESISKNLSPEQKNTDYNSTTEHILWKYRRNEIMTTTTEDIFPSMMITVMVWPLWDATVHKLSSDVIHIERNGIEESSVLQLATEPPLASIGDPNMVWLTDTKYNYKYWCERFAKKIRQAQDKRRELNAMNNGTTNLLPLRWPIFVVDFTDLTKYKACPPVEEAVGKDFVLYSKRSIVVTRQWNGTTGWVDLGESLPKITEEGRSYLHTPLVARTDTIQSIRTILLQSNNNNLSLADPKMESLLLNRPVDISHFWETSKDTIEINPVASKLRDYINLLIRQRLNDTNHFVGLIGTADIVGRRVAQVGFIEAMLQSKIIVVSQRDKWEDQYRLYEALVSGALVMTDQIVAMPRGLENGTSIVEFGSADEFVRLVRYYLKHVEERIAIARRGREVAMTFHRSWHRMEEIVLGRVVTKCAKESNKNCPFVVQANETS